MGAIEFSKVTKIYKNGFWATKIPAVVDLSFSIPENCITGFIGPNGSGKTTTIKMLFDLVHPTDGTINIRGIDSKNPNARQNIGFVTETPYFYRHLSIMETLVFNYRIRKLQPALMRRDIEHAVECVGLTSHLEKKIHTLSKGLQQRLNMAQAIMGKPSILICDEPMSGLDPLGRQLFKNIFRKLAAENVSIFFSTHILDDIESICDTIIVLDNGKKRFEGQIEQLLKSGTDGTEFIIPTISEDQRSYLIKKGFFVSERKHDTMIFIPILCNVQICHRYLHEQNILPESISIRRRSLESVLYKSTAKVLL